MDTKSVQQLEQDITFVRQAVEQRDQKQYTSIAIAVLWAAIVGTGYTLLDVHLPAAMWFWGIAPVLGFLVSFWVGWKSEASVGVERNCPGWVHALHWGSMFAVAIAIMSVAHTSGMEGQVVGQLMTLASGIICFLAGLHLDRRFMLPGIALILGSAAVGYLENLPWTFLGLIAAISLIVSAIWMRPRDAQTNA
jgi:hypothetical protein